MEKPEVILQELNKLVEYYQFDYAEFDFLIKVLKEQLKTVVKFLDLEYYSEARMESARRNKNAMVKIKDFEGAFEYREVERECLRYIKIKSEYRIEKSQFYYDKDYLFYFCLGTAKNDEIIRVYLK